MFIVFDLDGTLALNEHRRHFVDSPAIKCGAQKKDWTGFFEACGRDTLNRPLATILRTMRRDGHHVEIWSGRTDDVIALTRGWLYLHDLLHVPYKGRPVGNFDSDIILKHGWLSEDKNMWPDLMFDDRDRVVAMWRELGIQCCQVAKGDF